MGYKDDISCGLAVFWFAIVVMGGLALSALTTMVLWNWFATTLLGLPELSFWGAAGVAVLISYFTASPSSRRNKSEENMSEVLTYFTAVAVMKPAMFLVAGWVVVYFIQ